MRSNLSSSSEETKQLVSELSRESLRTSHESSNYADVSSSQTRVIETVVSDDEYKKCQDTPRQRVKEYGQLRSSQKQVRSRSGKENFSFGGNQILSGGGAFESPFQNVKKAL
jgi:hypothetical protein